MPLNIEHILIYVIVLITAIWFIRRIWLCSRRKDGCGGDCSCKVKRNPVIEQVVRLRRKDGK